MAISLKTSDLVSREIRDEIGERTIGPMFENRPDNNNIIASILSGIGALGGFLFSKVRGFFSFSFSKMWALIVASKQYIWNFNWNASDNSINQQIQEKWKQITINTAATAGNALGWLFCGILPSAAVMAFNEPLGAYLMSQVAEEARDELAESFGSLFQMIYIQSAQIAIASTYKSVRKLIKSNSPLIGRIFGEKTMEKAVQAWGANDAKPWSFAIAYENSLEKISNSTLREAVEEFGEEFDESCIEAGYVVANSVDSFYAQKMLEQKQFSPLGETRYVEISPNRNNEDETIVLGGKEELLKPIIIQTLANNQMIGSRSIGEIYGTSDNFPVRSPKPEVVLKFFQRREDRLTGVSKTGKPIANREVLMMQISFRLMEKSAKDFEIDDIYAKELAEKIYSKFAKPIFKITKGIETFTYTDWAKGYQLTLHVSSQAEATKIVRQILDIQGHSMDSDKFRIGSKPVSGERKEKRKEKSLGKIQEIKSYATREGIVSFRNAFVNIGNGTTPINLVDLTGKRRDVVFRPKS
jgi:hypothetical protein